MCHQNHTIHPGCSHYDPLHPHYTLCPTAHTLLMSKRGPNSPAIAPPQDPFFTPKPPQRSSTLRSLRSFTLKRVDTATSKVRQGKPWEEVPEYEILPIAQSCPELKVRTVVSRDTGQVCGSCARWIELMRDMIVGYDKGRGVRGNAAFKEFLEGRGEGGGAEGVE